MRAECTFNLLKNPKKLALNIRFFLQIQILKQYDMISTLSIYLHQRQVLYAATLCAEEEHVEGADTLIALVKYNLTIFVLLFPQVATKLGTCTIKHSAPHKIIASTDAKVAVISELFLCSIHAAIVVAVVRCGIWH